MEPEVPIKIAYLGNCEWTALMVHILIKSALDHTPLTRSRSHLC